MLVLAVPPRIRGAYSEPLAVCMNNNLLLVCIVSGFPRPDVTWRQDDQQLTFNPDGTAINDASITLVNSTALQINSAAPRHSVTFECVAVNPVGRDALPCPVTVQSKVFHSVF